MLTCLFSLLQLISLVVSPFNFLELVTLLFMLQGLFPTLYEHALITTTIKSLSQLCWGWLHQFFLSIPIYLKTNPWICCIFSNPAFTTSIYVIFGLSLLLGGLPTCIDFFSQQRRCWPTLLDVSKPSQTSPS